MRKVVAASTGARFDHSLNRSDKLVQTISNRVGLTVSQK
jgi:hypothetical protein